MTAALSIITVTFRDMPGLLATAHSLPVDLPPEVEWIVVDGGSGSEVSAYLQRDKRATWISEPDHGLYHAMNKGVSMATGRWLLFLNGGDRLVAGVLDPLLVALRAYANSGNDPVLYGHAQYRLPSGATVLRPARLARYALYGMPAIHQSILFPRAALPDPAYPQSLRICGDYALVALLYRNATPFEKLDMPIAEFSTGGRSYSQPVLLLREAAAVQRQILRVPLVLVLLSAGFRGLASLRLHLLHALNPQRS